MISDKETIASATSTGMFTNDLCSLFASYYYTQKKILLEESDLAQAYFIINRSIVENRNLYVKKKILVSSRYGIFNARRVALAIQKKYSPYLSTIDTCEFSDLFNINLSAYDLLATDENSVRYVNQYRESPVAIKHLTFSSFRSSNDFKQLNQYFDVTSKQDALQIFKKDNIHKIEIHSEDDVYSFLTQFYSEQLIHSEQFVQSIKMRNHFINPEREKGIIMLSTLAYKLSHPTFELIIPSNEFVWDQRKVNLIIFYQHGDGTTENRTLISLLCSQFIHQPEAYLSQLINMEYESMLNDFKPDKYI